MSTTPKIELRDVYKSFGRKKVLDGVNLTVTPGESLVIIGGSGSGKSVLIKNILGLIRPNKGKIFFDGKDITHDSFRKREPMLRKCGMLFQGGALFDSLPVWRNIAFVATQGRGGLSAAQARALAVEKLGRWHAAGGGRPHARRAFGRHAETRESGARDCHQSGGDFL